MDEEYDVIVLGMGLKECTLSGLLSVDGLKEFTVPRLFIRNSEVTVLPFIEFFLLCSLFAPLSLDTTSLYSFVSTKHRFEPLRSADWGAAMEYTTSVFGIRLGPSISIWAGALRISPFVWSSSHLICSFVGSAIFNLLSNVFLRDFRSASSSIVSLQELPESIGQLRNLQTLNIMETKIEALPRGISKLLNLRHLLMGRSISGKIIGVRIPSSIRKMKKLQSLAYIESEGNVIRLIGSMTQLTFLGITNVKERDEEDLCALIQEMKVLSRLFLFAADGEEFLRVDALSSPPPYLDILYLEGKLEKANPPWVSISFFWLTADKEEAQIRWACLNYRGSRWQSGCDFVRRVVGSSKMQHLMGIEGVIVNLVQEITEAVSDMIKPTIAEDVRGRGGTRIYWKETGRCKCK
ncbi:unnamed protein product [Prunus armeniaca]